jgi:hypothetical protein
VKQPGALSRNMLVADTDAGAGGATGTGTGSQ